MSGRKEIFLGFDPGGAGAFGWCVADGSAGLPLHLLYIGKVSNAAAAVAAIAGAVEKVGDADILGAGIDGPLFWSTDTKRSADAAVRKAIANCGARNRAGTVQQLNSLRGACLVQALLIAKLIHDQYPRIRITETHPKALLWLLGIAKPGATVSRIRLRDIERYVVVPSDVPNGASEHERDAAVGALAAWHMLHPSSGWRDLVAEEPHPFFPLKSCANVGYWMPLSRI